MKKVICPFTLIAISIFLIHSSTLAQSKAPTIIQGKSDILATVAYLYKVNYLNPSTPEILVDTISNQSFKFELDIDKPEFFRLYTNTDTLPTWTTIEFPKLLNSQGYYYFNCYGYYQQLSEVFIQPGDSINIKVKFNKRGQNISEYTGDRAKENKFLANYRFKSNNKRGLWAYTFFGTGSYYKKRTAAVIINKSNKERRKIQKQIDSQNQFSASFINYLTNDNTVSALQVSSNVLNYIDSSQVRLYFEKNADFKEYNALYSNMEKYNELHSYERKIFVYMELMTTYNLNLKRKQAKRYYAISEDKYFAAMEILDEPLSKLYGAYIINLMKYEDFNKQILERLIIDYSKDFLPLITFLQLNCK